MATLRRASHRFARRRIAQHRIVYPSPGEKMLAAKKYDREINKLVEMLVKTPHGGDLTYEEMTRELGVDIRCHRYLLNVARQIALDKHAALFRVRLGQGLVRLLGEELPEIGATSRARIRRTARTTTHRLKRGLDGYNLDPAATRRVMDEMTTHALLARISSDATQRRLAAKTTPLNAAALGRQLFAMLKPAPEDTP
jgi:plasmid stabilization system protein ParE